MTTVTTDRRQGINSGQSIKVACVAASTGNLTLEGEQTVDGIALVDGDRCFAKDQTDTTEIGIYTVSTGTWTLAPDFDGPNDVTEGTIVPVSRGTTNSDTYWKITNTGTITPGTTAITLQATTVLSSAILNDGSVKMIADFSPNATDTYDLGTAALKWQDLHLNGAATVGGSVHLDDGILFLDKGADVASANALSLGSDGNYFDITGTTAITSIDTKGIGTIVHLHFDAALTLTHNATDLILPGAGDITTAAGDEATFIEYAAGDWRCINYQSAGGPPYPTVSGHVRAGNMQLIDGTGTVTALDVQANFSDNVWESVGPTGSGATNIMADMDNIPSTATFAIFDVWLNFLQSGTGSGDLRFYAVDGDASTPSSTTANWNAAIGTDVTTSEGAHSLTRIYVPLNSSAVFQCAYNVTGATVSALNLYYRGFMTD